MARPEVGRAGGYVGNAGPVGGPPGELPMGPVGGASVGPGGAGGGGGLLGGYHLPSVANHQPGPWEVSLIAIPFRGRGTPGGADGNRTHDPLLAKQVL